MQGAGIAGESHQAEFHAAGSEFRERILVAANQSGENLGYWIRGGRARDGTISDVMGRQALQPATRWVIGSESVELLRKEVQRILLSG